MFVTGATGFVGKAVVEKLLRHAPDLKRIYMLIRPKNRSNGVQITAEQRLCREVIPSSVFDQLRSDLGGRFDRMVQEKLVAVSFDLTLERLGIAPLLYEQMAQEVDIVISCAAAVVFDEPLDLALEQNTLGPKRIVEFARACQSAVLVHVSTAYVNGQRTGRISEEVWQPDQTVAQKISNGRVPAYGLESEIASIQKFSKEVELASHQPELQAQFVRMLDRQDRGKRVTEHRRVHQVEALRQRWKREQLVERGQVRGQELGWLDGYTMTKAMGEQIIVKMRGDLPTAIVRPSIIESSLSDPEPGWIDGLKVADPLIAHYGKGRLPDFPANPDAILDIIPVDYVTNVILSVLPKVRQSKDVQVYHVTTGSHNPILVRELVDLVREYFIQHPFRDRNGKPIPVLPWKYRPLKQYLRRCRYRQQLPLKAMLWLMDRVPLLWSSRFKRRISLLDAMLDNALSLCEIYSPYTNLDCEFQMENIHKLQAEMDPQEREIFNCDVSRIHWPDYMQKIHIPGLKRHVLKTGEASKENR
ncbi:MAG: SDR family oxidoreductase [bacterium]|nr:SDR family oxidoreductase [bacterium]